jgi:ParB/RepB/Spo0J family partition protein
VGELVEIPLRLLAPSPYARPTNHDAVKALVGSIGEHGLLQPIVVVRAPVMDRGVSVEGFRIVAGHHRVAAFRQLDRHEIPATVLTCPHNSYDAEIAELDENLCRHELSPAERAAAIRRRADLWEAKRGLAETGGTNCPSSQNARLADGRRKGAQHQQQFAAETAAATGKDKREVNRELARARAVAEAGADPADLRGTSLDKAVELDALAKKPVEERRALIQQAKAGEQVTARAAPAAPPPLRKPRSKTAPIVLDLLTRLEGIQQLLPLEDLGRSILLQLDTTDAELHARLQAVVPTLHVLGALADAYDPAGELMPDPMPLARGGRPT